MNLHEYQAKELLLKFELPLLKGKFYIDTLDGVEDDLNNLKGPPWVVKSQIHAGGGEQDILKTLLMRVVVFRLYMKNQTLFQLPLL